MFDEDLGGMMASTCRLEMGARWITFLILLFSIVAFGVWTVEWRNGGYILSGREDEGEDGGIEVEERRNAEERIGWAL